MEYANWFQRAAGMLIDWFAFMVIPFVGILLSEQVRVIYPIAVVIGLAVHGYNRWFQAGRTGQSWGRRALGIRLVGTRTGRPIGPGLAFGRDLAHFLDSVVFYVGWLWPAFDVNRQTFADKIAGTSVVKA